MDQETQYIFELTFYYVVLGLCILALLNELFSLFAERQKQDSPNSYSTENSHEVTPGESCNCPVADCSICGGGK